MKRTLGTRRRSIFATFSILSPWVAFIACGSKSMPPPPPAVSVALTPVRGGAVTGQSITFNAMGIFT